MSSRRASAMLLCLLAATSGCSRRVTIDSVPQGARVYVRGSEIGRTPVTVDLASAAWYGLPTRVRLERDGYVTVDGQLDWRYDPRHLWWLPGILLPPTQVLHLHPRIHRRLNRYYLVVLDEDLVGGTVDRRVLYGSRQLPAALEGRTVEDGGP